MNRLRGARGGCLCALLALNFFATDICESFAQTGSVGAQQAAVQGDSVVAAERTKFVEKLLGEMTLAEKIG